MGLQDHVGKVKPNMLADLLVLNADPLESAENLSRIDYVVRAGRVFEQSELASVP